MYAKLGDIEFKELMGFDSLSDARETTYAQHPLLNGKPILDRTGEGLIEFTMNVTYHVGFCNPEDEFAKLNDARAAGTVLPFVYGNGFIEGDFVITKLDRTINKTDNSGNLEWISVAISLLEYISGNTAATQQARDKANAFAVSSNRPLPSNPNTQPVNPALDVMNENQNTVQATNEIANMTDTVNASVNAATSSPPISLAQKFVDQLPAYTDKATDKSAEANDALTKLQSLVSLYPNLATEQPQLSSLITNSKTVITSLNNEITVLGGLPSTISNVGQANTALDELANLTIIISDLISAVKSLKSANATIAKALVTKKDLT